MVLDDTDIRSVLGAATTLASSPVPELEAVLDLLRSLIPCTSVSFNDMTLTTGDYRYLIVPPDAQALAERLKPVYDRLAFQHPLIVTANRNPLNGALRFCDVPGGEQFSETDLYREFFEPFGLRYQLAIQLPSPPDVVVGYALNRSAGEGEFSDRDVEVLNALDAHLAMHHRQMFDAQRARAMAAETDLSGGWAVMTVRNDGVVEASSSTTLQAAFTRAGSVPADVAARLPTFYDIGSEPHSFEVSIDGEGWRCVVHPTPIGPTVLLVRRLGDEPAGATPLIDLGLTPRQIEVAIALVRSGGTNSQLARSLQISEGTVKKHLETVFSVLGVESRAAAVVALTTLIG